MYAFHSQNESVNHLLLCSLLTGLNLGKKISVPKDVMMEELNLSSNRGSRMFQERQRRAEKFTLENVANGPYNPNVRNRKEQTHCKMLKYSFFPESLCDKLHKEHYYCDLREK